MVTFPSPKPSVEIAEHPRGTIAWINANPSLAQIAGKLPIDQPPTPISHNADGWVRGKQPAMPGLAEVATAANTAGSAH